MGRDILFSEKKSTATGISYPDFDQSCSRSTRQRAIFKCQGLGSKREFDPALIIPNPDLTIDEGAIVPMTATDDESYLAQLMANVCRHYAIPTDVPWRELNDRQRKALLHGEGMVRIKMNYQHRSGTMHQYETNWEGVIPNLNRRYRDSSSDYVRGKLEEFMSHRECPTCHGKRLRPEVLAVRVKDKNIDEVTGMSIGRALAWVQRLDGAETEDGRPKTDVSTRSTSVSRPPSSVLSDREQKIAKQIIKEIRARLTFLVDVGLDYLTLNRSATTLSGGESQRIRLATQVGSQLMGVLYVLDEPSIGLRRRRRRGSSPLCNACAIWATRCWWWSTMTTRCAPPIWIIDMGPGAGEHGGNVVAIGNPTQISKDKNSLTGAYLSGRKQIALPDGRRGQRQIHHHKGREKDNLKNIDVEIPLGKLVVVTGVSGSGKSSLIVECLYKRCAAVLNGAMEKRARWTASSAWIWTSGGAELPRDSALDKIINIDQQPIGRTPRSNPATYTGLWTPLRDLFAELPESKIRGYKSGRFSFNVKGGRCEACEGQGQIQIQMQFMPDIYVTCDTCKGTRFNRETLQVKYKGKNIAEVLDMTVTEGMNFGILFHRWRASWTR